MVASIPLRAASSPTVRPIHIVFAVTSMKVMSNSLIAVVGKVRFKIPASHSTQKRATLEKPARLAVRRVWQDCFLQRPKQQSGMYKSQWQQQWQRNIDEVVSRTIN